MIDTVPRSLAQEERPLQLFREQAHAWLSAHPGLAHWWSPQSTLRDEAIRVLLAQADMLAPPRLACLFQEGDFLALLQKLNGLLAAAQSGPLGQSQARAHAGQLWVLDHAERVSAEHVDILRRICLHYPELQIHLALFSQTAQAPAPAQGVQVHALWPSANPLASAGALGATRAVPGRYRYGWIGALVCAVAVLSGLLLWRSDPGAMQAPQLAAASEPVAADRAASKVSTPPSPPVKTARPITTDVPAVQAVGVPSPEGGMSASRRWALSLPPGSLAVVHAQMGSLREAEAFRKGKAVLANARILQTSAPGTPVRFLVVTGPFRSPERVQNYMQRLEWKSGARSIGRDELLALVAR